jgi:hypothetical protein
LHPESLPAIPLSPSFPFVIDERSELWQGTSKQLDQVTLSQAEWEELCGREGFCVPVLPDMSALAEPFLSDFAGVLDMDMPSMRFPFPEWIAVGARTSG